MSMVVSIINNVSAEPFRLISPHANCSLENIPPSSIWKYAIEGKCDLALIPVVKLGEVKDIMEVIDNYGIACDGPVRSVLFFSKKTINELSNTNIKVYFHNESETSVRLLEVLWYKRFNSYIKPADKLEDSDGALWIGDSALRISMHLNDWREIIDLSYWWRDLTGYPFVFARWTIRKSASIGFKQLARNWLLESSAYSKSEEGQNIMIARTMKMGLFSNRLRSKYYFKSIITNFSSKELRGENEFFKLLKLVA